MQRWYQPCMQDPKPRKEAEEALSGCGGEEGEAEVVRVPTIHKGALVLARRAAAGKIWRPFLTSSCLAAAERRRTRG